MCTTNPEGLETNRNKIIAASTGEGLPRAGGSLSPQVSRKGVAVALGAGAVDKAALGDPGDLFQPSQLWDFGICSPARVRLVCETLGVFPGVGKRALERV